MGRFQDTNVLLLLRWDGRKAADYTPTLGWFFLWQFYRNKTQHPDYKIQKMQWSGKAFWLLAFPCNAGKNSVRARKVYAGCKLDVHESLAIYTVHCTLWGYKSPPSKISLQIPKCPTVHPSHQINDVDPEGMMHTLWCWIPFSVCFVAIVMLMTTICFWNNLNTSTIRAHRTWRWGDCERNLRLFSMNRSAGTCQSFSSYRAPHYFWTKVGRRIQREYLLGFRKRKDQRRKFAKDKIERRIQEERKALRDAVRLQLVAFFRKIRKFKVILVEKEGKWSCSAKYTSRCGGPRVHR